LDLPRRVEIVQLLRRLAGDSDRAVLLSTHDLDLALRCADRLWLLPQDGLLQTGAPEDLVLSGAFQRAFADVEFDPAIGSFQLAQESEGAVGLVGEGLYARWTERALERAGFSVVGDAPTCVEIISRDGDAVWRLHTATGQRVCATLYELVKCLKLKTIA
jgi:iron complex transport system ATP-binding protein